MLQNFMNCVESEAGSCSATCVTCDADGTEGFGIKVEESIDIKDEITEGVSIKVEEAIDIKNEIPEAILFPEIKTEPEVMLWGFLCGGGNSGFLGYLMS
jgi:hypothetical protein